MTVKELISKVSDITLFDYYHDKDATEEDILICALEDMLMEYKNKEMEFDDYKEDVADNMRPLTHAEQIGSAAYRGY